MSHDPEAPDGGKAWVRTRLLWIAWYPRRGSKCQVEWQSRNFRSSYRRASWHLTIAFGPAYLGLGPGIPYP